MITLSPMSNTEFDSHLAETILHYAEELIETGFWSEEAAHKKAEAETMAAIEKGLGNSSMHWMLIEHADFNQTIGYLWFTVIEQHGHTFAFISDIEISAEFRRKGFAKEAFKALEKKLHGLGVHDIRLHVFKQNKAAQALYTRLGFEVTSTHMRKALDQSPES